METLEKIKDTLTFSHYTTYRVLGHAVHFNGDPLTNQKIELFVKGKLAEETTTDANGKFEAKYGWPSGDTSKHQLIFKIYAQALSANADEFLGKPQVQVDQVTVEKEASVDDIGNIKAEVYEFDPSQDVPLYLVPKESKFEIAKHSPSWLFGAIQAVYDKKLKEILSHIGNLDVQQIQDFFGVNQQVSLSPETTIQMLLNGIYPAYFQKGEEPDEKLVVINWDRFTFSNNGSLLPNATLKLGSEKGQLSIKSIDIQQRGEEKKTYTKDSEGFLDALYLFNSACFVRAQVVFHLALGHLLVGFLGQSVLRCLNKNKLKDLLRPHFEYVIQIDNDGKSQIFGKGVLSVTALGPEGTDQLLKETLAGFCWSNFKPREKICRGHTFAEAENLMWKVLTDSVDQFFNEFEKEIIEDWYEIYDLSKLLVEYSPEYSPWDGVEDYSKWADQNEIDDPTLPGRVTLDGKLKAMRPITLSREGPQEGDIERLKQFSKTALYFTIFHHQQLHYKQKELLNLSVGTIAPKRANRSDFGGTTKEDAIWIFSIVHTLLDLHNGNLIEKNPYHNIYPGLIENLEKNKEKFKKYGIDISKLQIGTQF